MNSLLLRSVRLLALLAWFVVAACSRPAPDGPAVMQRTEPWPKDLVTTIAETPVQDGGRVKPFSTLASFALYFVHGRRDLQFTETTGGERVKRTLDPTEWLLDVWCFPDQAADYPLFRIENNGVLDALGLENPGQSLRFEFLSYRQLLPHGEALAEQAKRFRRLEARDRTLVQEHLVQLDQQLATYHRLHQHLGALHADFQVDGAELQRALGGAKVRLGGLLERAADFVGLIRSVGQNLDDPRLGNAMRIVEVLSDVATNDRGPSLFPPAVKGDDTWHSLGEIIDGALRGTGPKAHVEQLGFLQAAVSATDMSARAAALRQWHDAVEASAKARGEYAAVALEAYYYRANWQYQSLHWFLLAFVLAASCWVLPRNKFLWWASIGVSALALGMVSYDIYLRCVVTSRPPIKNLYDTFLFIAATGAAIALVVEFILPRRIALAVAPVFGAMLVMAARRFEVTKGEDTMAPLVAVLDSNYWLATHVTMINLGYAAGLIAALFANLWIVLRLTRAVHPDDVVAKVLQRVVYGITCFSLIFAVVGTIYGGVWANDSWGRFWGWDPKENGALLICLAQIALLHARMCGWVRDAGFAIGAAVTGAIVLFSWFHVNLLGVGLHNYGFSSGLRDVVWSGYTLQGLVVVAGVLDRLLRPNPVRQPAAASEDLHLPAATAE